MNHKSMIKFVLLMVGIVFFYLTLNAFWLLNDPHIPPNTGSKSILAQGVRGGIVDASSELLLSASEAFQFMNEIELAEVCELDYGSAKVRIEEAIEHLQRSTRAMEWVVDRAEIIGVERERVERLRSFDYHLLTARFNLNNEIMARVTAFLSRGDVVGLYKQHLGDLKAINEILLYIRTEIAAERRPADDRMWLLLHMFNNCTLTANYATLVFYQV